MRSSICNPFFPLAILVLCLASPEFSLAQSTVFTNGVQDKRPETYAFTHVTLFIDYQTKIENATLVIKDGVVVAAGANIAIPSAATIEDLAGAYIYPSFIDLHTDFGLPEVPKGGHSFVPQYTSGKKGAYSWNQAIKPEINAVDLYKYNDAKAIEWRRAGFGTALTHYKDGISRGTSALVLLSEGKEVETLLVPKAASHFSFSKGNSTQEYPTSLMGAIALLRQTYYDAEWYAKNPTKETNLSLQAINDQKQLPWFFETSNKLNFLRADKLGDEFGKQYIIKGSGDEYQIISGIKATQAKVVLPINFPKAYDVEDPLVQGSPLYHKEMTR